MSPPFALISLFNMAYLILSHILPNFSFLVPHVQGVRRFPLYCCSYFSFIFSMAITNTFTISYTCTYPWYFSSYFVITFYLSYTFPSTIDFACYSLSSVDYSFDASFATQNLHWDHHNHWNLLWLFLSTDHLRWIRGGGCGGEGGTRVVVEAAGHSHPWSQGWYPCPFITLIYALAY